jgi:hypothetical protein
MNKVFTIIAGIATVFGIFYSDILVPTREMQQDYGEEWTISAILTGDAQAKETGGVEITPVKRRKRKLPPKYGDIHVTNIETSYKSGKCTIKFTFPGGKKSHIEIPYQQTQCQNIPHQEKFSPPRGTKFTCITGWKKNENDFYSFCKIAVGPTMHSNTYGTLTVPPESKYRCRHPRRGFVFRKVSP